MIEFDELFDMGYYCEDCDMDPAQCYELGRCIYEDVTEE